MTSTIGKCPRCGVEVEKDRPKRCLDPRCPGLIDATIKDYTDRAEECRAIAGMRSDEESRSYFAFCARNFDRMAQDLANSATR